MGWKTHKAGKGRPRKGQSGGTPRRPTRSFVATVTLREDVGIIVEELADRHGIPVARVIETAVVRGLRSSKTRAKTVGQIVGEVAVAHEYLIQEHEAGRTVTVQRRRPAATPEPVIRPGEGIGDAILRAQGESPMERGLHPGEGIGDAILRMQAERDV